ncbi:MAG TPA: tRNA (guanosine(37)-N1)-methyltransferase TrmD [Candidatus Pelethocola excrementipullorum]|nr:tRNA (guanosine(37)-N1)-methyltransferase TrmD [Candidatus Pelethocola excrementipullorum]
MRYHVLTLFPEMIDQAANTSILGRAVKNGSIQVETTNIRDYSANKHMRVDDYPYGGGAGMVMEAEPVYRAYEAVKEKIGHKPRTIYLTPQGKVLNQTMVEEFALDEDLVLICGHYEGIDERVLEEVVTDYVSIGDYVLTGGELGAMVMIDAISRFVPGVLSNEESSQFESLQDNLLEYPHYTRPEVWHEKRVPQVLLSGDHKRIEAWRYEQSVLRTTERRPDLLRKSYRVHCAFYGGMESGAGQLNEALSRYGTLLDFNRKKLRKQRYHFERQDLLVVMVDEEILKNPGEPEAFSNVRGKKTPCMAVITTQEEQLGQVEEKLKAMFDKQGFLYKKTYHLPSLEKVDKLNEIALDIRRKMEEIHEK